jgi:hypothetical protein
VYEADVEAGVPFIAMRYVEGETLARRIASARERGLRAVALGDPAATEPDWNALAGFFAKARERCTSLTMPASCTTT